VRVLEEFIGEEDEFAHEGGEGEFFGFTGSEEAVIEKKGSVRA